MNRVTRGEQILGKYVTAGLMSEPGMEFLICATDPFHDRPVMNNMGWPDLKCEPSVIRCVKQQLTVTKNVLLSAGPWDCQIAQWPFMDSLIYQRASVRNNNAVSTLQTINSAHGGLEVQQKTAAGNYSLDASSVFTQRLTLDDNFIGGDSRVIGLGFEVVNDTAPLYRSGHVIGWRLAQGGLTQPTTWQIAPSSATNQVTTSTCVMCTTPPLNSSQAALIPGAVSWKAEDGIYSVGTFITNNNTTTEIGYVQPLIPLVDAVTGVTGEEKLTPPGGYNVYPILVPSTLASIGVSNMLVVPPTKIVPINMNGCSFTGLSEETVLTITYKVYVETFPTTSDQMLLPLAKPSCPYDIVALECLSRAARDMPHACMVGDNPDGEWWADLIDDIAGVGSALANSFIPGSGALVTGFGRMLSKQQRSNAAEKKTLVQMIENKPAKQKPAPRAAQRPKQNSQPKQNNNPNRKAAPRPNGGGRRRNRRR